MDFNHNGKDDILEIKDGFNQFVSDVQAGNINAAVQDVVQAGAWIKGEIEGMVQEAQDFFNWGVARVIDESKSLGEAVANMLALINNGNLQGALGLGSTAMDQLRALATSVIEAAIRLIGEFKTATA